MDRLGTKPNWLLDKILFKFNNMVICNSRIFSNIFDKHELSEIGNWSVIS